MEQSILSLLIFLPVFGAVLMLPISKYFGSDKIKWTALAATGIQLLLAVWLYINFDPSLAIAQSPFTVNIINIIVLFY